MYTFVHNSFESEYCKKIETLKNHFIDTIIFKPLEKRRFEGWRNTQEAEGVGLESS